MLWLSTSGRAAKIVSSASGRPCSRRSAPRPGRRGRAAADRRRSSRRTAPAPPSGRSSRATVVTTANRRPIRSTASATRSGSSGSSGSGWRVSTRQKPQARVQRSPLIMNVAVPSDQHSEMFGQPASSHTVTRPRSRTVRLSSSGLRSRVRTWARIHSGLRSAIARPSLTPASASRPRQTQRRAGDGDLTGAGLGRPPSRRGRRPCAPAPPGPSPRLNGARSSSRERRGATRRRTAPTPGRPAPSGPTARAASDVDHLAASTTSMPSAAQRRHRLVGDAARHDVVEDTSCRGRR